MAQNAVSRTLTFITGVVFLLTPFLMPSIAAAAPPHNGAYVALGDSVAAGLGLAQPANPSSTDVACGLSTQAYAVTVARSLNMPYVNAACSGATIDNLSVAQRANGVLVRPQLDTAFSYGVPSLISITAGANDAHWQQLVTSCFISTCGGTVQTMLSNTYLASVQSHMKSELQQISSRSQGNPPLTLVTGYYNPISANCSNLFSGVTPAEVSWIAGRVTALNTAIQKSTVGLAFVTYVPVTFQGHGICDPAPWIQTFANAAPFHPNLTGQNGLAYVTLIARNQAIAAGSK